MTAAHRPELVAAAQAAVTAGMAAAQQYHEAAAAAGGMGALVSLPSINGAVGEGYDLPPNTPAIRPVVRPAPSPSYADLVVGGIGPGGYHGNVPGSLAGALEGVPVARSDSIVYLPASSSSPATSRPSLTSRLTSAWKALWGR